MAEIKIWARIGANITIPMGTCLSDIDELDFAELYAENKLEFTGDSYVPDESEEYASEIVEDEKDNFSLDKLSLSNETQRALYNVLQSVENIKSFISYADCDDNLKQDVSDMSDRFLKALQIKISGSF